MSLVVCEGKVEDGDAGEVGSHSECQVSVQYLNRERERERERFLEDMLSHSEQLAAY